MHPNVALLNRLFNALDAHNHEAMASCYHPEAEFRDIAFHQKGAREIRDMWRMICRDETKIEVTIGAVEADDRTGRARVIENYRFGATNDPLTPGRAVTNEIESRFVFENGLILRQDDDCDPKEWAKQAMGGIKGFLAGHVPFLRRRKARKKLEKFVEENPG
jgi:hypothetical protein